MTLQEAAEKAFEDYRGCNMHFWIDSEENEHEIKLWKEIWIMGAEYRQPEIDELKRWKSEMLQLWDKLDSYMKTRNDITIGQSKVERAIEIMKERDVLRITLDSIEGSTIPPQT